MSDNEDGKLPARSRKTIDEGAQQARASEPAIGVDRLRDLQQAIEQSEDSDR